MKRVIFFLVSLLFIPLGLYAQSELTRVKTEPLWYTYKEQYADYNLIFAAASSEKSIKSGVRAKGYDGIAAFSRYDLIKDKEAELNLMYKVDLSNSRINMYLEPGLMPFYVKFRDGQACVYALDEGDGKYYLLGIFDFFNVQNHLNN